MKSTVFFRSNPGFERITWCSMAVGEGRVRKLSDLIDSLNTISRPALL
uniref:Uncharacterized protein n=1 Tax=Utricularia reniformis TaxID=192314 RepID=A0A1Y0B0H0_9LAMI|nr:hypothetical protein AEK19_MT0623 [Utricularia reniformis]ART30878.1 hypothetical protein AEK19_MT0623 [Utricularia reniformis]